MAGLAVTLGNPKVIAFYCGFLPGFVHMPKLTGGDVAIIAAIMMPIVLLVPLAYAWAAAKGRQAVLSTRAWKAVNRGAGTVMIGTGVVIVTES
jgi:threonine/homoserine/homoserine lactone efflux protein